jgi:hypothetical protein
MSKFTTPRLALAICGAVFVAAAGACNGEGAPSAIAGPQSKVSPDVWQAAERLSAGNVEVCINPSSPAGDYILKSTVEAPGEGPPGHGIIYDSVMITLPGAGCAIVFLRDAAAPTLPDPESRVTTEIVSYPPGGVSGMECRVDWGTTWPEDCVEVHTDTVHVHAYANFWHGTQAAFTFVNPGVPLFVIGDVEPHGIGANVYFWGSQWWKKNSMSGFVAKGVGSFKGYASEAGMCGDSWISRTGDSPPPPQTIGSQIGIIVTGTVGKFGPDIGGEIRQILLVDTDEGYGPNPGHPGTGSVVSVVCTAHP